MDYMTNIYWHTEIPEGPGHEDLKKLPIGTAMLLIKYNPCPDYRPTPETEIVLLPNCTQNIDGSWSIINADDSETLVKERHPDAQIMAWGEFPIKIETVEQLCDASNRDNYGITERDYKPRCFINARELPCPLVSDGGYDEIDHYGIDFEALFKE